MERSTTEIFEDAREASVIMRGVSGEKINTALEEIARVLVLSKKEILAANALDIEAAKGKLSDSLIDRLFLNEERIDSMAKGVLALTALDSPCGRVLSRRVRENRLLIEKISVPLGVIGIIYESRPNVTSDAAALAIKSSNAVVLRSGKEAFNSARAIVSAIRKALLNAGLPENAVNLISDRSRKSAEDMMKAVGYIDLLIPRGGRSLISSCVENAKVPCIETGVGICHIYVDSSADLEKALNIVENAKAQRPSVCNAAEVLLVHSEIAGEFLPRLYERLVSERRSRGLVPVELRCSKRAFDILPFASPAASEDFDREFLDYILAVKIVDSEDEAILHIAKHSTGHSEAIVTEDSNAAELFTRSIDSAAVYVNASTRFTDGGEFGLGCEMGISTQKLHARGPFGVEALTTYKYVIHGEGQIR